MSPFFGSMMFGKRSFSAAMISSGVVDRQRGLRHVGQQIRDWRPAACAHVLDRLDQVHALFGLAHGALDFRVAGVADHDNLGAMLAHLADFDVDLGHQRASGIEHLQAARLGFFAHRLRDAVRRKHQRVAWRDIIEVFDEDRALAAQVVDDIGVVDDLVAHVDRRTELAAGHARRSRSRGRRRRKSRAAGPTESRFP